VHDSGRRIKEARKDEKLAARRIGGRLLFSRPRYPYDMQLRFSHRGAARMRNLVIFSRGSRFRFTRLLAALSIWLCAIGFSYAQSNVCELVPDEKNPPEKMLKCGDSLLIRSTKGAKYRKLGEGQGVPSGVRLDSGAVMIEFTPGAERKDFQILTPHAIAAVRGTKWIVEVDAKQTSTLVLSGGVTVSRRRPGALSVILDPGEGADVTATTEKIEVKRWPQKRVKALLSRFGG
jgi:hypothetical protein